MGTGGEGRGAIAAHPDIVDEVGPQKEQQQ
jgi:hypothetical protein